ncbi:ABC transporter permease [Streptomyces alboflavus]|uniref:ABC transporter permease n=1 Tax=Streptomyces alboflavus TaxID=67267 RepID=A0A1Z1WRA1_9ACTN|nr:ABC transporter permease [Streptomyces alboflavus]
MCGLLAVLVAAMAAFAVVVLPVPRPAFWFWLIYSGTLFPLQIFSRRSSACTPTPTCTTPGSA